MARDLEVIFMYSSKILSSASTLKEATVPSTLSDTGLSHFLLILLFLPKLQPLLKLQMEVES